MNRTKLYYKNILAAIVYQIVFLAAGLITPRIFLTEYGSEINGLITSLTQFFTYLALTEAGLTASLIYALYQPLANQNVIAINGVVSASRESYIQVGLIYSALTIILALGYPFFVTIKVLSTFQVIALVLVLGLTGVIDFFTLAKCRALLTADQRGYVISYASALSLVVNTVITVLLAYLSVDVIVLKTAALSSIVLRSITINIYVRKHYSYLRKNVKPNKDALSKRWDALLLQVLGVIQSGAPIIIATAFIDLLSVSIYGIFNIVFAGVSNVLSVFTNSSPASFGNLIATGERSHLQRVYQQYELVQLSIGVVVFTTAAYMIIPFIKLYTQNITDANYILPMIGLLFAVNGFIYHIKTPGGMLVMAAGLYRETRIQSIIQALIIIVCGVILAHDYGLTGILLASILSNLYRTIDLLIFVPKFITGLLVSNSVKRTITAIILFILMLLPLRFFAIEITTYWRWMIVSSIVFLSTSMIVLIVVLVFDRGNLIDILNRIKSLWSLKMVERFTHKR